MTTAKHAGNNLFPVFLKLDELCVLIVGGGKVGLEKIKAVLFNSPAARIILVAPSILPEIIKLASEYPAIKILQRSYMESDLDFAGIVITATNNRKLNEVIRENAARRKLLVNVADTPDLCDFYLGSVVRKGDLKIAVSTNGKSPTMAKRIKEVMNDAIPDETQEVLENLSAIRGNLKNHFEERVRKLNAITSVMVQKKSSTTALSGRILKASIYSLIVVFLLVAGHLLFLLVPGFSFRHLADVIYENMDRHLPIYILGGFTAQMIDGALGMAYGVSVTTFLLSLGIPSISPAIASASMHASEIFVTGSSSLVYMRHKNINKRLFRKLLLPGAIGAILGALTISFVSHDALRFVKPFVALYTLFLGSLIIIRATRVRQGKARKIKNLIPLGAAGGFLDSVGGGGWGPIVTTSLIAGGRNLRYSIGSSHLVKFFVATISTITFFSVLGMHHWQIIVGLVIGGMLAAPLSIYFSNKIPIRFGLILIGSLVILVSLRILILTFF